jgi:hypothetical protein
MSLSILLSVCFSNPFLNNFKHTIAVTKAATEMANVAQPNQYVAKNTKSISDRLTAILHTSSTLSLNDNNNNSLLNPACSNEKYPMISLPEGDNYWSEGWKCTIQSNELASSVVTASVGTHSDDMINVSTSSASSSLSSSPSPSPSTQSSISFKQPQTVGQQQQQQQKHLQVMSHFDSESLNEQIFREAFAGKEQIIFYGQDVKDQPFILSYKNELVEFVDSLRILLR